MMGNQSDVKNHLRRKIHKNILPFKPLPEPAAAEYSTGKSPLENEAAAQEIHDPEQPLVMIATRKRPA